MRLISALAPIKKIKVLMFYLSNIVKCLYFLLKMLGQEIVKNFCWFKTSKFPSEITWPLSLDLFEVDIISSLLTQAKHLIQTCKEFLNKK